LTFQASRYGETIEQLLALDGGGLRPMPLVCAGCTSAKAKAALTGKRPAQLFPNAPSPDAALSGLWLYFGCFNQCHEICQDLATAEGAYWHAILHRQEPDPGNAAYWFRRVGRHALYPALVEHARDIVQREPGASFTIAEAWDPFAFVDLCESARQQPADTPAHRAAREIQLAEWQLLFDDCARPRQ
jgi:hypothetical protein